jgi:hypothetical protein
VTATVDMLSGGRSNYSVGRLRIGIFYRKLGCVVLTLLSSCGVYAPYSVCHPIRCLLGVICNNMNIHARNNRTTLLCKQLLSNGSVNMRL